jgi:hypothetical protein
MIADGGGAVPELVPALEALLGVWQSRYESGNFPARPRLAPADMARWERNTAWIEAAPGGRRRILRFGVGLIRRFGRESTGHFVEDLAADIARSLGAKLDRAGETGLPAIGSASVQLGRDAALFREIAFPLARDAGQVTQFLFASYEVRTRI